MNKPQYLHLKLNSIIHSDLAVPEANLSTFLKFCGGESAKKDHQLTFYAKLRMLQKL